MSHGCLQHVVPTSAPSSPQPIDPGGKKRRYPPKFRRFTWTLQCQSRAHRPSERSRLPSSPSSHGRSVDETRTSHERHRSPGSGSASPRIPNNSQCSQASQTEEEEGSGESSQESFTELPSTRARTSSERDDGNPSPRLREMPSSPAPHPGEDSDYDTLSPSPEEVQTLLKTSIVAYALFQLEKAPSTGQLHYQGYLRVKISKTLSRIINIFKPWKPHIEISKGSEEQNVTYCSKSETRVSGPWTVGTSASPGPGSSIESAISTARAKGVFAAVQEHPDVFVRYASGIQYVLAKYEEADRPDDSGFSPWLWQQQLLDLLDQPPDDRRILWIADPKGHSGKSRLATHLILCRNAILLEGSLVNMAYLYKKEPIALFDVSRSSVEVTLHFYGMAEKLKNGWIVSTKYQPVCKRFNPPHVVFFSNDFPDKTKWTEDRYAVYTLSGDPLFMQRVPFSDIPVKDSATSAHFRHY